MAKEQVFLGIDMDSVSIRGVRLSLDPDSVKSAKPVWRLLSAAELANVNNGGNFLDDAKAVSALKNLRENLKTRPSDKVSICLSGKQTYSVQMDTRRLPPEEMSGMLKLELRKSIPFEAKAATFDYQILPSEQSGRTTDAGVSVMIGAVANSYLERQVNIFEKAGLPPCHVNVLPVSVANAFWAAGEDENTTPDETVLLLHLGADVCTLVIDGRRTPFFNRTFSFNIAKAVSGSNAQESEEDMLSSMDILAAEVAKSAAYYKNTQRIDNISSISVLGAYASHPAFDELAKITGYPVRVVQTASLVKAEKPLEPGKYDLAIALAMQAA